MEDNNIVSNTAQKFILHAVDKIKNTLGLRIDVSSMKRGGPGYYHDLWAEIVAYTPTNILCGSAALAVTNHHSCAVNVKGIFAIKEVSASIDENIKSIVYYRMEDED